MRLPRRTLLRLLAGAAVPPAAASAQAYPSRPVRIIIGFAAGGAFDITARLIAQRLSDRFGQPFIVENRPGAGTNLATEAGRPRVTRRPYAPPGRRGQRRQRNAL